MQKTVCCLGGHGFICHHIARKLKQEGWWVRTVDISEYKYGEIDFSDDYIIADLRNPIVVATVLYYKEFQPFDLVIQMAADMGGMEYLASGEHDAEVMHNSALINLNVAYYASLYHVKKLFYSSSACIYPMELQGDKINLGLKESDAVPAHPDLCYGWEKLHSEIVYDAFHRNAKLDIAIGRFHNIFGIEGTWEGIRAKAPAALCRKVALAKDGESIEVFGTGQYTRSFLEVNECIEGIFRLLESGYNKPLNIGSDESISINGLAQMIIDISGKNLTINNVHSEAVGVVGRNSDNELIQKTLNWKPTIPLKDGITNLYHWVNNQINTVI